MRYHPVLMLIVICGSFTLKYSLSYSRGLMNQLQVMLKLQALFHLQTSLIRHRMKTSRFLCHVVKKIILLLKYSLLFGYSNKLNLHVFVCFEDTDGLISQALLVGNFEGAVDLCLNDGRYAEAILLSISGGEELLKKTQQKYLSRQKNSISMVRERTLHQLD